MDVIKDMIDGVVSSVRTIGRLNNNFPITIALYEGSILSPYLSLLIDDPTGDIHEWDFVV